MSAETTVPGVFAVEFARLNRRLGYVEGAAAMAGVILHGTCSLDDAKRVGGWLVDIAESDVEPDAHALDSDAEEAPDAS